MYGTQLVQQELNLTNGWQIWFRTAPVVCCANVERRGQLATAHAVNAQLPLYLTERTTF